jgi:SAM-dependent MidA family methyltransferase
MVTDLLARPGEQDITCHLCWDVLSETLMSGGFEEVKIQTQESFLLNLANRRIQKIFEQKKEGLNEEMQALRELIHPAHLGHGIQVLWGRRNSLKSN